MTRSDERGAGLLPVRTNGAARPNAWAPNSTRPERVANGGQHTSTEPVRIMVCDDHEVYRLGLRALMSRVSDLAVVAESADPAAAMQVVLTARPQVAVIGFPLAVDGTPGLIKRLDRDGIGVVVLADADNEHDLIDALRAGARGYLPRRVAPTRLLDGIRAVARRETALDSTAAEHLAHYLDAAQGRPSVVDAPVVQGPAQLVQRLTARQREVVRLVADGLSNAEVGAALYVSQATVKSHLTIILRRLGLRDRTQLAILVHRTEAVDAGVPAWE